MPKGKKHKETIAPIVYNHETVNHWELQIINIESGIEKENAEYRDSSWLRDGRSEERRSAMPGI
jgi:hypothetical protein